MPKSLVSPCHNFPVHGVVRQTVAVPILEPLRSHFCFSFPFPFQLPLCISFVAFLSSSLKGGQIDPFTPSSASFPPLHQETFIPPSFPFISLEMGRGGYSPHPIRFTLPLLPLDGCSSREEIKPLSLIVPLSLDLSSLELPPGFCIVSTAGLFLLPLQKVTFFVPS